MRPSPSATVSVTHVSALAWNVGHRAGRFPAIPAYAVEALRHFAADVILLNEYYDDGRQDRGRFHAELTDMGYTHQGQSAAPPGHNRVFIASRLPFVQGDVSGPTGPTPHAATNFLHVQLAGSPIELIGLRRPSYTGAERTRYWTEVSAILSAVADRPLVVAGDVNEDLFKRQPAGVDALTFPWAADFSVPRPAGPWSYISPRGTGTSIDHVLHTGPVNVIDVRYHDQIAGIPLAVPRAVTSANPIDHAVLTFSVDVAKATP